MHENRTTYPKRKTEMYQQLLELPKKYKTISIIQMRKVRSTQILLLLSKFFLMVKFV
jgi:large subunit ribosomal protein L10